MFFQKKTRTDAYPDSAGFCGLEGPLITTSFSTLSCLIGEDFSVFLILLFLIGESVALEVGVVLTSVEEVVLVVDLMTDVEPELTAVDVTTVLVSLLGIAVDVIVAVGIEVS